MKSTQLLLTAALAIAIPASVFAAKDPAAKEAKKAARQAIAQYDKNGNGTIDADEADALKKAFDADKTGPLKQFDTNGDGKLDDTEIAAIHIGKKGDKAGKKAKPAAAN
jgi:type II secretory pathway pseudopilin PulG